MFIEFPKPQFTKRCHNPDSFELSSNQQNLKGKGILAYIGI